jgi:hypothetical protein
LQKQSAQNYLVAGKTKGEKKKRQSSKYTPPIHLISQSNKKPSQLNPVQSLG